MEKVLSVDILTPDGEVYSGEVTGVQVQGTDGRFEVLFNHAPIISTLSPGQIVLRTSEGDKVFKSGEGVIEVIKNKVIILVEEIPDAETAEPVA